MPRPTWRGCRRRPGRPTACRAKPSANTRRAPGPRRHSGGAPRSRADRPTTTAGSPLREVPRASFASRPFRSIPSSPIDPVLDALDYIHRHGLVHRDVKPDNIMITSDGRPVLIDFGALKIVELQTAAASRIVRAPTTYVVATPHYAPPEQYDKNAKPGPPTDVYAIAAVLYRAFGGHPPENAQDRTLALAGRRADPYVSLAHAARVDLAAPVVSTIDRALSYHAEDRPGSAAQLRAGLGWDIVIKPGPGRVVHPRRIRFEFAARSIIGSEKPQGDSWRVIDATGTNVAGVDRGTATVSGPALLVVAGGIDRSEGGDLASRVVCDNFSHTFFGTRGEVRDRLNGALLAANEAIAVEKQKKPKLAKMGSTLIGAFVEGNRIAFVSVGDSLLLRFRDD